MACACSAVLAAEAAASAAYSSRTCGGVAAGWTNSSRRHTLVGRMVGSSAPRSFLCSTATWIRGEVTPLTPACSRTVSPVSAAPSPQASTAAQRFCAAASGPLWGDVDADVRRRPLPGMQSTVHPREGRRVAGLPTADHAVLVTQQPNELRIDVHGHTMHANDRADRRRGPTCGRAAASPRLRTPTRSISAPFFAERRTGCRNRKRRAVGGGGRAGGGGAGVRASRRCTCRARSRSAPAGSAAP